MFKPVPFFNCLSNQIDINYKMLKNNNKKYSKKEKSDTIYLMKYVIITVFILVNSTVM